MGEILEIKEFLGLNILEKKELEFKVKSFLVYDCEGVY